MIYMTGDTHTPIDIHKLSTTNFKEQQNMTKNDYVIICGDFGGVWNNSKEDKYWCDWLNDKNFTTLFIDGNHENFDLLNAMPVRKWNNGKVHFIRENVIHLMRGQIFQIDGLKIFTMGGAESIDKCYRKEGISWWEQETPSTEEYREAINNLDKCQWNVDYIISHTAANNIIEQQISINPSMNALNSFFNLLEKNLKYKHWFFGHFHQDIRFSDNKHTLLYNNIIKIEDM